MSLFAELKRRKVFRVAGAYAVVGWLVIEVAATVLPQFQVPDWAPRMVTLLVALGFPIVLVMAWVFDITPDGIKVDASKAGSKRMLAIAGVLAALAVGWYYRGTAPVGKGDVVAPKVDAAPVAVAVRAKSIAVLPFTDLSPGHDQEYFSDGMSEEILNALAQVKDLKVAGRTSSFSFKGKNEDLRTIGKALGVANVLEGSVRKQGDKVRITAQLIQTSDDTHLWSRAYDGDMRDVFALQERVARAITDQLKVVLQGEQKKRLVPMATSNPEAYVLYLQATDIFNRRDGAHFQDAVADLKEAIRLDPKYARAHSRLAGLYSIASGYSTIDFNESSAESIREAHLAIALDPTLAEGYAVLGVAYSSHRQWQASVEATERAIALDAADTSAVFWKGTTEIDSGYLAQGTATMDRVLAIDPLMTIALRWRALLYRHSGDLSKARRLLQQSIDAGQIVGETSLAMVAHDEGKDQEAIARFTRGSRLFLSNFPGDASQTLAQGIYGDQAARAKAVAMVDAYLATRPKPVSGGAPWALLLLGQPERALAVFQEAPTTNDALFLTTLWWREGAAARKLPQFAEFARKTHLAEFWDKYGPPDLCRKNDAGDYVCE